MSIGLCLLFFNLGHILKLGELTTDADLVSWNVSAQEYVQFVTKYKEEK
jgi:hypothetical protein